LLPPGCGSLTKSSPSAPLRAAMCGSGAVASLHSPEPSGTGAREEAVKSPDAALRRYTKRLAEAVSETRTQGAAEGDEQGEVDTRGPGEQPPRLDAREEFKRMLDWRGAERRIDPEDGQVRTFAELQACCAGAYSPSDVDAYWRERCKPASDPAGRALMRYEGEESTDVVEDSDGERVRLCHWCNLPCGQSAYEGDRGEGTLVHGECRAQLMLQGWNKEQDAHWSQELVQKKVHRKRYDIGWKVERVPRNVGRASKFAGQPVPQGMCCVALHRESNTARVAATADPAAAVNLEYLALALQVRFHTGGEPFLSLDPVDLQNPRSVQEKRFEPPWLAGTCLGEVLFQADYYLKELSMGEHTQPVAGMRSGFDFSEDEGHTRDWTAREWFVVRDAAVHMSRNEVLVPRCRMGVEAREQAVGDEGLQDVPLTRPDHPLVKYAELFEHNFDLIAERKGAIYHLREVAKASILAKYLLEAEVRLEEVWFEGPSGLERSLPPGYQQHIPQLWNERCHSQIWIEDGNIIGAEKGFGSRMHGVYGGVQFGLERFRGLVKLGQSYETLGPAPITLRMMPLRATSIVVPPPPPAIAPPPVEAPTATVPSARSEPQGVDLNLDQFDLTPTELTLDAPAGCEDCSCQPLEACIAVGETFWSNLDADAGSAFNDEDKALLKAVFNPNFTDRRDEGDRFVPPDSSLAHVQSLRTLVGEEASVLRRRTEHFAGKGFAASAPGALFPSSWTPSLAIMRGRKPEDAAPGSSLLTPCSGWEAEAAALRPILRSAIPTFDKCTEDGTRFRIYRVGSFELRTTQRPGGEEAVGAVFSVFAPAGEGAAVPASEKIVQVVEYVERNVQRAGNGMGQWPHFPRFYVQLRSEGGHTVVTEKLRDGTVTWSESPANAEARNALAKVVYTADCQGPSVTVGDMRSFQAGEAENASWGASYTECKRYAHAVCGRVARACVSP